MKRPRRSSAVAGLRRSVLGGPAPNRRLQLLSSRILAQTPAFPEPDRPVRLWLDVGHRQPNRGGPNRQAGTGDSPPFQGHCVKLPSGDDRGGVAQHEPQAAPPPPAPPRAPTHPRKPRTPDTPCP